MALLVCRDLALGYEGKTVAENISFTVNSGDYLCIVGENGSGKSTLVKTILNLILPIRGEIITDDGFKQNEIGYLPQQTEIQKDFPASVWEIVLSGCLNKCGMRPFYNKSEKELAKSNMEKLKISHLSKCCYRDLSGGQQQRVLLARALCSAGKVILLDEPSAGLDPNAASDMYDTIDKLNKDENITVIIISHDIFTSIKYASHILHIGDHTSLFFGTREDYLKSDTRIAFKNAANNF